MATADQTTAPGAPEALKHVLDTARAALDHEFQRAERLDAKARGQATLAGSWFAVTQAVAAVSIRGDTPKGLVIAIAVIVIAQATALFLLFRASAKVWRLKTRDDIGSETLAAMGRDAEKGDPAFASKAVAQYRYILHGAQQANAERARALDEPKNRSSATYYWWPVLSLGVLEIVVALISRVVS